MKCPNCGADNLDTSKFCKDCGNQISYQPPSRPSYPAPTPRNPTADAGTIGSITSILGGGLIVLGWLLPWFSLGSLLNSLLRSLSAYSFGINLGGGIGSGVQIFFGLIVASFAAFGDGDSALFGLLGLVLAFIVVLIPIWGVLIVLAGIKVYELRAKPSVYNTLISYLQSSRKRAATVFIRLLVIFILMSLITTSILGGGYWLMALSAIGVYFGAFYTQNKLRMLNP